MLALKKQKQRGFTLVELLVTISIFVILTGVVLFSQTKFNSSILLTNLAYDTALTIRQAQNYGINIKEFNSTNSSLFLPYGVHFDRVKAPKSFILFADTSYENDDNKGDGLYDELNEADLSSCSLSSEIDRGCVNKYNILRGNYIATLCVKEASTGEEDCTKNKLDIVFQRPNPDAHIRADNASAEFQSATVVLQGADGSERRVRVYSNGLIEVVR